MGGSGGSGGGGANTGGGGGSTGGGRAGGDAGSLSFVGDFESGLGDWSAQQPGPSSSGQTMLTVGPRQGAQARRFPVVAGQTLPGVASERSTVVGPMVQIALGTTEYFAFSTYAEQPLTGAQRRLFTLHSPDNVKHNVVTLVVEQGTLRLWVRHGPTTSQGDLVDSSTQTADRSLGLSLTANKWHDFVLMIRWAADGSGAIELWHREEGETTLASITRYDGETVLTEAGTGTPVAHYAMLGLLRPLSGGPDGSNLEAVRHDGYCVGDSFAAATGHAFP